MITVERQYNLNLRKKKFTTLSIVLIVIVAFFCGIMSLLGIIYYFMTSSVAYEMGMKFANNDPVVEQFIGKPIKSGLLITGSLSVNNSEGKANISIPVSGPKGSGVVYVVATKEFGKWSADKLVFQPDKTDD